MNGEGKNIFRLLGIKGDRKTKAQRSRLMTQKKENDRLGKREREGATEIQRGVIYTDSARLTRLSFE